MYAALAGIIRKHPILSAISADEESPNAYFVHFHSIDLQRSVFFIESCQPLVVADRGEDRELDVILQDQHYTNFKSDYGTLPFWYMLDVTAPDVQNQFTASFIFHPCYWRWSFHCHSTTTRSETLLRILLLLFCHLIQNLDKSSRRTTLYFFHCSRNCILSRFNQVAPNLQRQISRRGGAMPFTLLANPTTNHSTSHGAPRHYSSKNTRKGTYQ